MNNPSARREHSFHIPVMGTGFTIDSPLYVAKYGISSVVSLVDDTLIEMMRKFHCERTGEAYEEIASRDEDARARRITAYLNLLDRLVSRQVEALRASPFKPGSEITRYYEMLPESPSKRLYREMLAADDPGEEAEFQERLRRLTVRGGIDVNIMSRIDGDAYRDGKKLPQQYSDASAALRGYANSSLRSSVVFSAGMNPRLYTYAAEFDDFLPDADGVIKKEIVLKVSDYRSAVIQGKFLAKRGLWVSEYRVESGLNCGGHAYATTGLLMGPILDEFRRNKSRLTERLHAIYVKALAASGRPPSDTPREVRISAQGGIGTATENALLLDHYGVDATGWGTPFLLVPEVVNVDRAHLEKLSAATEQDVFLSDSSPFGIPFWNLRDSASEDARRRRIDQGTPGSPCRRTHIRLNTEFTEVPVCVGSRNYQRRKLRQLTEEGLRPEQFPLVREHVLAKSCICHDLGGGVLIRHEIDPDASTAVCPSRSIADFSKIATLEEMVDHIHGRAPLPMSPDRPHIFVREATIYVEFLRDEIERYKSGLLSRPANYFEEFVRNLIDGMEYYGELAEKLDEKDRQRFLDDLGVLRETVGSLLLPSECRPVYSDRA